ncbi:MAG: phenylalanine--tRNA ligase subunit beta [Candidatus Roizmanbacteria bacterium]
MKVPLNWLKQYVEIPSSVTELTDKLTAIGHMQDKKPEKVGDDIVIDLEVRQNRSDCYSILGVAREVAAITNVKVKIQKSKFESQNPITNDRLIQITNANPSLCKRFKAVRIKLAAGSSQLSQPKADPPLAETPPWMKDHLEAYGIKVISPIVDITNYVMIETGEPMHAFDIRAITDAHITIRSAKENEKISVIGGKELTLTPDDLVIADNTKILSFSGLIGGEGTGISADTTEFVLEAATYDQACIRRSSIRHGVRTEASTRHEKFLDPRLVDHAIDRALDILKQLTDFTIVAVADSYPEPTHPLSVALRASEISRLGGVELPQETITHILKSLGFEVTFNLRPSQPKADPHLAETFVCIVPYWRTDILCEADLVEEVLRLYGYENIPSALPPYAPPPDITSYAYRLDDEIRDTMLAIGFDEVMTEPLTSTARYEELSHAIKGLKPVKLQNALNADKSMLRFGMDEGIRHALHHHQKFGKSAIHLFELGKVYSESTDPKSKQKYHEPRHIAYLIYEQKTAKEVLYQKSKGVVEAICKSLGVAYFDAISDSYVWDEQTVYTCINLEHAFAASQRIAASSKARLYTTIPHTQSFDISCLLPHTTKVGDMIVSLQKNITEIDSVALPEPPRVHNADQKSVLLRIVLKEGEQDKAQVIKQVEKYVSDHFQAIIR